MANFLANAHTMVGIMQRHLKKKSTLFWTLSNHKKASVKPQNFYVSCSLKTKKEELKKKKWRGRAESFEPYFANASSSRWLQQLVPRCNSPHIFTGPAINLCRQLPAVELLTGLRAWARQGFATMPAELTDCHPTLGIQSALRLSTRISP